MRKRRSRFAPDQFQAPENSPQAAKSSSWRQRRPAATIPLMTWDVNAQLARLGPDSDHPRWSRAEAHGYCARLARSHYENFTVASLLLPRRLLRHFHAVYAY